MNSAAREVVRLGIINGLPAITIFAGVQRVDTSVPWVEVLSLYTQEKTKYLEGKKT